MYHSWQFYQCVSVDQEMLLNANFFVSACDCIYSMYCVQYVLCVCCVCVCVCMSYNVYGVQTSVYT